MSQDEYPYRHPLGVARELEIELADRPPAWWPPGRPRYFYRFYGPNSPGLEPLLARSQIRMSSRSDFNDPFDVTAEIVFEGSAADEDAYFVDLCQRRRAIDSQGLRQTLKSRVQETFNSKANHWGLVCFASSRDRGKTLLNHGAPRDILMWSHYAGSHEGVCVQFRAIRGRAAFLQAQPVLYKESFVRLNWFDPELEGKLGEAFFRKAPHWSYESEFRLIARGLARAPLALPVRSIAGVIFGCRVKQPTIDNVVEMLSARRSPVKLFRARNSTKAYRLTIERATDIEALIGR